MRRIHWILLWLFGLPALLFAVFYFAVLDTGFSSSSMHTDTGIGRDPGKPDTIAYLEKPSQITLVLERGETESRLGFTDTGWREIVALELINSPRVGRLELSASNVRIGYRMYQKFGTGWSEIGASGVKGYIDIFSVKQGEISARYEINLMGAKGNREIVFSGRSTFYYKSRPTDQSLGDVWPKP